MMSVTLLEPPRVGGQEAQGARSGFFHRRVLTSRLMKLQGDMGIKTQTEVVVEDIQGQLGQCQDVEMREVIHS